MIKEKNKKIDFVPFLNFDCTHGLKVGLLQTPNKKWKFNKNETNLHPSQWGMFIGENSLLYGKSV